MSIKELRELESQLEQCKGYQITKKMELLSVSTTIFYGNANELLKAINTLSQPTAILLFSVENREELKVSLKNVIRLFHNYIASVKSLIDHTRLCVRKEYGTKDFWNEYNSKIGEIFKDSPISNFIQQLRNYILHKQASIIYVSESQSSIALDVLINKKIICSSGMWNNQSRKFMSSIEGDIKLIDIVNDYTTLVANFYKWFNERQLEIHKKEFGEMIQLRDKLRAEYQEAL